MFLEFLTEVKKISEELNWIIRWENQFNNSEFINKEKIETIKKNNKILNQKLEILNQKLEILNQKVEKEISNLKISKFKKSIYWILKIFTFGIIDKIQIINWKNNNFIVIKNGINKNIQKINELYKRKTKPIKIHLTEIKNQKLEKDNKQFKKEKIKQLEDNNKSSRKESLDSEISEAIDTFVYDFGENSTDLQNQPSTNGYKPSSPKM